MFIIFVVLYIGRFLMYSFENDSVNLTKTLENKTLRKKTKHSFTLSFFFQNSLNLYFSWKHENFLRTIFKNKCFGYWFVTDTCAVSFQRTKCVYCVKMRWRNRTFRCKVASPFRAIFKVQSPGCRMQNDELRTGMFGGHSSGDCLS